MQQYLPFRSCNRNSLTSSLTTDGDSQNGCGRSLGCTLRYADRPQGTKKPEKLLGGMIFIIDIEPPITILHGYGRTARLGFCVVDSQFST